MILSMTGFGRGTAVRNGREITVELRSVNSRYFEYSSRMPRTCSYMDSRLKKQLNEQITRGKVELSLTVQNVDAADTVVTVNRELARSYQQAMRDLSEELCIKNDTSASLIARFPDVLATRHADVDEEQLWEDVSAVTAQALETFVQMRAAEGAKMKADIESRLCFLEECVGRVETLSAGRVEAYTNRLYEKLKVILEDRNIDDARVLTEAAIFGDKTAVDEETVRLRSHIAQYRSILELDEPVGRKLDFLTQELNRETNTIGSKCQDLDITRVVVDMKAEIEKIREQIQNLESRIDTFRSEEKMKLINIGFGNLVSAGRVVAVVSPDSAPVKRLVKEARERGMLIDASYGRSTRAVLIMDSDHVVLSALQPETVASRAAGQAEGKGSEEEQK